MSVRPIALHIAKGLLGFGVFFCLLSCQAGSSPASYTILQGAEPIRITGGAEFNPEDETIRIALRLRNYTDRPLLVRRNAGPADFPRGKYEVKGEDGFTHSMGCDLGAMGQVVYYQLGPPDVEAAGAKEKLSWCAHKELSRVMTVPYPDVRVVHTPPVPFKPPATLLVWAEVDFRPLDSTEPFREIQVTCTVPIRIKK
ncbi:MAG: hypothetical protein ACYTAF_03540 [Planctomycetota bacterium]